MTIRLRKNSLVSGVRPVSRRVCTLLVAGVAVATGSMQLEAQEAVAETPAAVEESAASDPNNAGQDDLNAAIDAKLDAETVDAIDKVIGLAQSALQKGLDEGNTAFAKQLLAAASFEKAKKIIEDGAQRNLGPAGFNRLQREVESNLKVAIENDPQLAEAYLLLARVKGSQKDREGALDAVNQAIDLLNDDRVAKSEALAMRALLQSAPDERQKDLAEATELNPRNLEAWQLRVALAAELSEDSEAVKVIEDFLATEPDNDRAVMAAIEMLIGLDKAPEALNYLNQRVEAQPENASWYQLRGRAKLMSEDFPGAVEDLSKTIDLAPQDAAAFLIRAQAYLLMDPPEVDKASSDIEYSLRIQPNTVMGLQLRAQVASLRKNFAEAIADIQLLIRNAPNSEFLEGQLLQLAQLYIADDRPSAAIKVTDELMKLNAENWLPYRMRGDAYLSLGQQKEAIVDYEKALTLMGESVTEEQRSNVLNNLSWVLSTSPKDDIRNGKRALELGVEACELTEYKAAHILSTLAAAYAETGDFEKAKEWSAKAVELEKSEPDSEQLEQLESELKSYEENKPWRELQETEEEAKPNVNIEEGVDA